MEQFRDRNEFLSLENAVYGVVFHTICTICNSMKSQFGGELKLFLNLFGKTRCMRHQIQRKTKRN